MIIDTTYLLPLSRIGVRTDLIKAVVEGRARGVRLGDLKVSLISIFELQAKAAKLDIPTRDAVKAVNVILRSFQVIPFYRADIIETAHELRGKLADYIDSIIVATAAALGEDLATEDTNIHAHKKEIEKSYNVKILSYKDLVKT